MKNMSFILRIVSLVVVVSLLCSISIITINSASGSMTEYESNDYTDDATRTFDDYDNYGKISSASDIDFWTIEFDQEGMANFWLGNIPSGCNYDMYVFEEPKNQITMRQVFQSINTSNSQEFYRIHVKPSTEAIYIIGIISADGSYNSTSSYHLRVKNTPGFSAKYYVYDESYNSRETNTYQYSSSVMPKLLNLDLSCSRLMNKSAEDIWNSLPNDTITIIASDAKFGTMYTYSSIGTTELKTYTSYPPTYREKTLSSYENGALSNSSLIVFLGNWSAEEDIYTPSHNLIDMAISKGASNAIGWLEFVSDDTLALWLQKFFQETYSGYTLQEACVRADNYFLSLNTYFNQAVLIRYIGTNNRMDKTILK